MDLPAWFGGEGARWLCATIGSAVFGGLAVAFVMGRLRGFRRSWARASRARASRRASARGAYLHLSRRGPVSHITCLCRAIEMRQAATLWAIVAGALACGALALGEGRVIVAGMLVSALCALKSRAAWATASLVSEAAHVAADDLEREQEKRRRDAVPQREDHPLTH